jgi:phenylacetate-CoA ligase
MRALETALCARHLFWLARTRRWRTEQIEDYQRRALCEILRHAVATVPFYRALGIHAADLSAATLSSFPLLTKSDVQENAGALISEPYRFKSLRLSRSSGSTGRPTATAYDADAWALTKHALKLRRVFSDLRRPPYRVLVIGEESPPSRMPSRFSLAASCRVSIHDGIPRNLEAMERFRPTGIYGSPSWLLELAQTAKRERRALPRARVVWTSSEVLTAAVRREIGEAFGCDVRDVYGSTEFKEVAVECPYGRLHINFESSYVEILPGATPGLGAVVITSLVNRAMPLIRYRIGDIGRLVFGSCSCGRAAPWLTDIGGREVDLIPLPDGSKISPYALSTVVEGHAGIARYQLLELAPGDIEVRYQVRPGVEDIETTALASELERAVGRGLRFFFVRTDDIERTPAGKYRPLIRSAHLP